MFRKWSGASYQVAEINILPVAIPPLPSSTSPSLVSLSFLLFALSEWLYYSFLKGRICHRT